MSGFDSTTSRTIFSTMIINKEQNIAKRNLTNNYFNRSIKKKREKTHKN